MSKSVKICTNLRQFIRIYVDLCPIAWVGVDPCLSLGICENMYDSLGIDPNMSGSVRICVELYVFEIICKNQQDSVVIGFYKPVSPGMDQYTLTIQVTLKKRTRDFQESWMEPSGNTQVIKIPYNYSSVTCNLLTYFVQISRL